MADPHLVSYLAERDEPCPACGYNLRALQTDRCPECNRELVLQLRLAEPRMAAWIASISGAAAMIGFNGLLMGYFFFYQISRRGTFSPPLSDLIPLAVSLIVASAGLALLIRTRRAFGNLPEGLRVAIALGSWLVTIASAIVFFSVVR